MTYAFMDNEVILSTFSSFIDIKAPYLLFIQWNPNVLIASCNLNDRVELHFIALLFPRIVFIAVLYVHTVHTVYINSVVYPLVLALVVLHIVLTYCFFCLYLLSTMVNEFICCFITLHTSSKPQ